MVGGIFKLSPRLLLIVATVATGLPLLGHAQVRPPASPGGGQASSIYAVVGAVGYSGSMGTKNQSIEGRTMNSGAGFLQLGYSFGNWTPYLAGEYLVASQATKANQVSNSNLGGEGYVVSAGVRFDLGWLFFAGEFAPHGVYQVKTPTVNSETSTYEKPLGGIATIGVRFKGGLEGILRYRVMEYQSNVISNRTFDLGQNPMVQSFVGAGLQWKF